MYIVTRYIQAEAVETVPQPVMPVFRSATQTRPSIVHPAPAGQIICPGLVRGAERLGQRRLEIMLDLPPVDDASQIIRPQEFRIGRGFLGEATRPAQLSRERAPRVVDHLADRSRQSIMVAPPACRYI